MTVEEAAEFFKAVPAIRDKMETLKRVGLGYIKVGQQATTLSGGEAQRVKLSKELSRRATGRTLYILDEPTTGLHFEDTRKLLEVLHELVDHGNTVVVIEHNLDVVKTADWIVDFGPEGGDGGGEIIADPGHARGRGSRQDELDRPLPEADPRPPRRAPPRSRAKTCAGEGDGGKLSHGSPPPELGKQRRARPENTRRPQLMTGCSDGPQAEAEALARSSGYRRAYWAGRGAETSVSNSDLWAVDGGPHP